MPSAARLENRRRAVVAVSLVLFSVLALLVLGRIPLELPSSQQDLRLKLDVAVPGLTAPVIDRQFTRPLERALQGIPGVAAMDSVSVSGGLSIDLRITHRRQLERAQRAVNLRLEQARASWPGSIDPPTITVIDPASKVAQLLVHSPIHDPLALRDWAEDEFARRLRELTGVGAVSVEGGEVREILILPDQRRLAGNGLDFSDLLRAIRQNAEISARPNEPKSSQRRRTRPMPTGSLAAVAAVPVTLPGGESIGLSEVAQLTVHQVPDSIPVRQNDRDAVRLSVHKISSAGVSDVSERIRAQVDWMRANRLLPEGIEVDFHGEHLAELQRPLKNLFYAFLVGFVLIVSAMQLMWGGARHSLILGSVILLTVQTALVVLFWSSEGLDVVELGGLVFGMGVCAGGVLMLSEAMTRSTSRSFDLAIPIVAAAVIVIALVPASFAGGDLSGYQDFLLTFVSAAIVAAALARWLMPLYGRTRWERPRARQRLMARAHQAYERLLRVLLPHSRQVLLGAALLLTALTIAVYLPARLVATPDAVHGRQLQLYLKGSDHAALVGTADAAIERLKMLPSIRQAGHSAQQVEQVLELRPRPERAEENLIDIAAMGRAVAIAQNGISAGTFRDVVHRYQVRLRLPVAEAKAVLNGDVLLLGELQDRPALYLRDVATLEPRLAPVRIRRHDGEAVVGVEAFVADGYPPRRALYSASAALADLNANSENKLHYGTIGANPPDLIGPMLRALSIAVLFLIILLRWWFRSWRPVITIVVTASVTLGVVALSLRLMQPVFSSAHWVAVLMVFAVSAAHATPGWNGRATSAASHGRLTLRRRFRLVTALTLIAALGLLPLLWLDVAGLHTIAAVLLFGLLVSWVMNLLLSPLIYWNFPRTEQN